MSIPVGLEFYIRINYSKRGYRYKVRKISDNGHLEEFEVIARNKKVVLVSDRPLQRQYSRTRRISWQMKSGKVWNMHFVQLIIDQLNFIVKGLEDLN